MAGVAADITGWRQVEEQGRQAKQVLSRLSHRLLEAHEQERTRIARELHDDFAQRMTLVAIELDSLATSLPPAQARVQARLQTVYERVVDLARDLQTVSHHLHSSKLEYVGLAGAAAGFCDELASQHNVIVDFQHAAVPANLPRTTALGLFRVLHEAWTNAVKHSRVRELKVRLIGDAAGIVLDVTDTGIGFDVDEGGARQRARPAEHAGTAQSSRRRPLDRVRPGIGHARARARAATPRVLTSAPRGVMLHRITFGR